MSTRSNIAVSDEIATRLSKMAAKENRTAYSLANDLLDQALKISEKDGRPEEIYGAWIMNRIGKDVGAFQWIGRNLMEQFVKEYGHVDPEKFSRMWNEAGFNFGVYLQICFPTIEDAVSLVHQLKQSFTIGRVDLVENVSEIVDGDDSFSLSIVASLSAELLTYLSDYWRGLLRAYGLEVVESKIVVGAVKLRFVSQGKLSKAVPTLIS
jgi:hypothetical protein